MQPSIEIRRGHGPTDDVHQSLGSENRVGLSAAYDRAGNSPGVTLLAEFINDPSQLSLGQSIHEVRCGGTIFRVHSHIERSIVQKAEPAGGRIELTGRDTEVEYGAINLVKRHLAEDACRVPIDRKSTRLNSSHVSISYAVFCLKKKNI